MVKMYKLKFTTLQEEIFRYLCIKAGASFNARGIALPLGVSLPAIIKSLPGLKKEGRVIIQQDKASKRWSIELNRDNKRVIQLKRAENLKMLYESGFADFLEEKFAGAAIVLFGSYSRGDDTTNSDIDIAIIGRKSKEVGLTELEKLLERKISLNFYDSFKEIHKHLKESIFNGIILSGGFEL